MGSTTDIYTHLQTAYTKAAKAAPALQQRFEMAGVDPGRIASVVDLSCLPVLKKEQLLDLQRQDPPFGGYLAARFSDLSRIYVSPGPIFEPTLQGSAGHGMDTLFRAAGVGAEDVVLNTWMYHLVPAGLLFDEAAQAVGATVIPGGVGNRELQAQIIVETGVTTICASTAFFMALADTVINNYGHEAWKVKTAFLGGEMGDWAAKRRKIEKTYGVSTWSAYATADLGMVGYEDGGEGYRIQRRRIVQICDPVTGQPKSFGEVGEVVVTTLDPDAWPMIRFGTGDSAYALEQTGDGTVTRLSALQGRVGDAVKVREIFVYPRAIEEVVIATAGLVRAQAIATRENDRDVIRIRAVISGGHDATATEAAVMETFQRVARIRLDRFDIVEAGQLKEGEALILNQKDV
ncbi:MAG: phenylacetate--CoA ligase family protein [Rhodobacteraceae bacterium]|nr:phenylacetate--CoA ligase family protein [Paracoccaceae bacterium]